MASIWFFLAVLFIPVTFVAPASAAPEDGSSIPFLGAQPGSSAITKELEKEIRQLSEGEHDALLEIIHLCEVDRGALSRKRLYAEWETRCKKSEGHWIAKYRRTDRRRMIDIQMRHYHDRQLALSQVASRYFAEREIIARKRKLRQDVKSHVKEAVVQRKKLAAISTDILRFFFAVKDLMAEAKK